MSEFPTIETERLHLRRFSLKDAPRVQALAGDRDVARTTANIPHPYEEGMAENWIDSHQPAFENGEAITLAVDLKDDELLIGAIAIHLNQRDRLGEIGYWIGKPYWNKGYCTEAALAVLQYGFEQLELNRIQARHMIGNPASGRVLEKIGMLREGVHRQASYRSGSFTDIAMWAILREEFEQSIA